MADTAQTLRVRPDTAELARVRAHVGVWAAAAGLGGKQTRRLQMAVDEAVANAIEHGMDRDARVMVRATRSRGTLTVTLRYRGDRFDPTTAPTLPAAETVQRHSKHGYGLHLIRTLVDEVGYRWDRGTNEVRLTVERGG